MSGGPAPTAAVFLNGRYEDAAWDRRLAASAGLVVAADGGAWRLLELGLRPDVLVGDLDSLAPDLADELCAAGVPLVRHPVRKDFTDGELAVDEALARGAGRILLTGGLGELDHELGHLALLRRLARRDVPASLVSPRLLVTLLASRRRAVLRGAPAARLSLVALDEPTVVSESGLSYPLDHYTLRTDVCLGLGNHIAGEPAVVTVHEGLAVLLVTADPFTLDLVEERLSGGSS